jgi:hypothetical protein
MKKLEMQQRDVLVLIHSSWLPGLARTEAEEG